MPRRRCVVLLALAAPLAHGQAPNYAEAFQHALYFYEAQTSGAVPLDHRVEWRGDSALRDGQDVGRDLTGGWYDAGDGVVWTGNDAFGATLLAWSLVNYREVFAATGQTERALDRLREIAFYLHKTVDASSPTGFRVYVGKGTTRHAPPDDPAPQNDRTAALPHETMDAVAGGVPQMVRPSYWVDATTGGADVAGSVAAALAAASVVFRQHGEAEAADEHLTLARTLFAWGDRHRNANTATRRLVEGRTVTIPSYPARSANFLPRLLFAAAWLHRAERAAATPGYTEAWIDRAEALFGEAGNAGNRGRPWVNFAVGAEQNGAYALLAADSGRAAFRAEADAYADFWLYRRRNATGLATDIAITPGGFVCRGDGGAWNIPALLDQAPPLLEWADSALQGSAARRRDLLALFTGTYPQAPVRQLDYILGFNPAGVSFLQGFAPPGKTWVNNLHYRANLAIYGGFGTPGGLPTRNIYPCYGLLAPGPDHTDFYPFDAPAIGSAIAYKEPIVYSGGLLTALARMIRVAGATGGTASAVFPRWIERGSEPGASGFYASAFREEGRVTNGVRLQVTLNNRASLPAREINTLAFRYYFTPDGVDGAAVTASVTGLGLLAGERVRVLGPQRDPAGAAWYFEVRFENATIVPGESSRYRRRVQLDLAQPVGVFSAADDFSGRSLGSVTSEEPQARLPVYDFSPASPVLLGGVEPSAGYVQWRRAHFNNTHERAGEIVVLAERVGGTVGAITADVELTSGTAAAGVDFSVPAGAAARLSWAEGEGGEKMWRVPVRDDGDNEGREYFVATLTNLTGGARVGATRSARVSIEDDDFAAPRVAAPPVVGGPAARLVNLSTRAEFRTGPQALIPGFVIEGGPLPLLVRAIGPALETFGLQGVASDPSLEIIAAAGGRVAANQDWGAAPEAARLPGIFRAVGAFPLAIASRDAARATVLPAGAATLPVLPGTVSGTGLVEIYETSAGPGRLRNLSTRGSVGEAAGPLIVGFAIAGRGTKRVLIRAAGPALGVFGVAEALRDPVLILQRAGGGGAGGQELGRNDDWPAALAEEFARAGAFAFPRGSQDAALVAELPAGTYTVSVPPREGAAGVALIELYDLDP